MKVDIRHPRHWDLENKLARGVDGYQQFTCPLERIQSMKRGLSRLQNLFDCWWEMKVFDHQPLRLQSSWAFMPSSFLELASQGLQVIVWSCEVVYVVRASGLQAPSPADCPRTENAQSNYQLIQS